MTIFEWLDNDGYAATFFIGAGVLAVLIELAGWVWDRLRN